MTLTQKLALLGSLCLVGGCAYHQGTSTAYSTYPYISDQLGVLAAAQTVPGASPSTQDQALALAVRQALDNDPLVATASPQVVVSAQNGTVTLAGNVPTRQERERIIQLASGVPGVQSLRDQIQLGMTPTGNSASRVYPAGGSEQTQSPASGEVFNLHVQGLTQPDRALAQRILQGLQSDTALTHLLPQVNIGVTGGRVTLTGRVNSEEQRRAITSSVRNAAGASNVTDDLQVSNGQ